MIKYSENFEKAKIRYGIIYKITNLINKKVYIGQTRQNPKKRWRQHKSAARTGENHPLYNGMRYHGFKNFNFQIIDRVPIELLDEKEAQYIKFFKSNIREHGNKYGYNLTAGGMGMKFRFIEKSILKDLIIRGYTGKEICDELRIGYQALSTRVYQLWQCGLNKARNYVMKSKIKSMIIRGHDITKIADEIKMSRTYIYAHLEDFWNVSSGYEARLLFRKDIIKNLLKRGFFLKKIADELKISPNTVSTYIKEYWNKTYTQAKHFLIKPYIKFLIENGSTEEEIAKKLFINRYESVHRYIKKYWGVNYIKARQEFFIKPILKSMIKSGYKRDELALEFSVLPDTINNNTKRFWNMTFSQTRFEFYTKPLY